MMEFLKDIWGFLGTRKRFWLAPVVLVLLVFGALFAFSSGSALSPFIYTLF